MESLPGGVLSILLVLGVLGGVPMLAVAVAAMARPRKRGDELDKALAQRLLREAEITASRVTDQVARHSQKVAEINEELGDEKKSPPDVVSRLLAANALLQQELSDAQREMHQQRQRLESERRDARTDPLTGIANRRAFDEELQRRNSQWKRQQIAFSVLILDVDHFKRFNDNYGHAAGDDVLRAVARCMTKTTREMDLVARCGGEEFSVVLPGTSLPEAKITAERVRSAVAAMSIRVADKDLRITASIGTSQAGTGESPQLVLGRADAALYAAKEAGRNLSFYHDGARSLPIVPAAAKPGIDVPPAANAAVPASPIVTAPPVHSPDVKVPDVKTSGTPVASEVVSRTSAAAEPLLPIASLSLPTLKPVTFLPLEPERLTGSKPSRGLIVQTILDQGVDSKSLATRSGADKRERPRHEYDATQFIAPFVHGHKPRSDEFREVQCLEVSSIGFSYLRADPEKETTLVVEFGAPPTLLYLTAKVVHCTPWPESNSNQYKVGCRFVGRLQLT